MNKMDLKQFRRNNKVGIKDLQSLRIIIPASYDEVIVYSDWIIAWKNPQYDENYSDKVPCEGVSFVFDKLGRRLNLSYKGERIDHTILSISTFDKYLYKAKARVNGVFREGLFSKNGDVVVPFEYEIVQPLDIELIGFGECGYQMSQLLYRVGKDVEYEWKWYDDDYKHETTRYRRIKHAKWGIIDQRGNIVIPLEYDLIGSLGGCQHPSVLSDPVTEFYGKFVVVTKVGKRGLFRRDGYEVLPPCFTHIDISGNNLVRFYVGGERTIDDNQDRCNGGLWGIGHIQNGLYTSPKYEAIVFIDDMPGVIAKAVQNGVAGTITDNMLFVENNNQSLKDVEDILHKSNVFWEREREYHDYGWTQAELDDMYRAAYENDPSASWNNYWNNY